MKAHPERDLVGTVEHPAPAAIHSIELYVLAGRELAEYFKTFPVLFQDGAGDLHQFRRKFLVTRIAPGTDVILFARFGDPRQILITDPDVFFLTRCGEQPAGGVDRVENIAHQQHIQLFDRPVGSVLVGSETGILAKSFRKQVEGAGGNGFGSRAIPQMKVADDDKHAHSSLKQLAVHLDRL